MKKIITIIALIIAPLTANSTELTATELAQICKESSKSFTENEFDRQLASKCKGYIAGFFDSMLIIERQLDKKILCMPGTLPKAQNNLILNKWIEQNKDIASKTTGTVALYAAFKTTFPCK